MQSINGIFAESSSQAAGRSEASNGHQRGHKACQACRIAKVKCTDNENNVSCARCRSAAIPCVYPPSRRGRVKGSKNKKTLEKLGQNGESHTPKRDSERHGSWNSGTPQSPLTDDMDHSATTGLSRPTSPFDPFFTRPASPVDVGTHPNKKARFNRDTLAHLEKTFPTDTEREGDEPLSCQISSPQKDLQNPLLFLAECSRRGWDQHPKRTEPLVIPLPTTTLPWEDQRLLDQWQGADIKNMVRDQKTFFQHGLYGSKRDVSAGLDAVQRGLISEDQVDELFGSYFRTVHPGFPLLDEQLHTPAFVRARSAYLFTIILATGATAIATLPEASKEQINRAIRLHAHVDKLQLVLCATAAKSVEIIQAEVLLQCLALRKPRLVDDQRSTRLGEVSRMASSIGLFRYSGQKTPNSLPTSPMIMNEFRLRVVLILLESRWETIADRKPISPDLVELTDVEFELLKDVHALSPDALLAADYVLHRFELESKERIDRMPAGSRTTTGFDSERIWIKTFIAEWEQRWVQPQIDLLSRWYFQYAAHRSLLVGLLRIARKQSVEGQWTEIIRQEVLQVSIKMLEDALRHDRSLHMLRPTSPLVFACTMVLQLSEPENPARNLILRIALRCAGNPKGEIMTYAKHNGFQILNMLCLSKDTTDKARTSISSETATSAIQPTPSLQQTLMPNNNVFNPAPLADPGDMSGTGWADLDQLLGYSGNVDFPYFPGDVTNLPAAEPTNDAGFNQWNDLFSNLANTNGWNTADPNTNMNTNMNAQPVDWTTAIQQANGNDQTQGEHRVNDFFHHVSSALGG